LPSSLPEFSDAARRCADTATLHVIADPANIGKWIAVRLADGKSDNTIYDSRRHAVQAHWFEEKYWAFCQLHPGGMQPKEAEVFLDYHRKLYDAGFRLPDPDTQMPVMPITAADRQRQIVALTKRK
jgi:hypothetical protein